MDRRALVVVGALLAVVIAVLGVGTRPAPPPPPRPPASPTWSQNWTPPPRPSASPSDPTAFDTNDKPPAEPPAWLPAVINAAVALAVLAAVAVAVRRLAQLRLARVSPKPVEMRSGDVRELSEADADELTAGFAEAVARLRSGGDVDDAIVRCWRMVEQVAARQGVARQPSQTAEEYTVEVLAGTRADRADMRTLADLYRAALFSARTPGEDDRGRAVAALEHLVRDIGATPPAAAGEADDA